MSGYRQREQVRVPQWVVAAIRLIGQRDSARRDKDWAMSDAKRDLAQLILEMAGCEWDLRDVKASEGGGTIFSVSFPMMLEHVLDTEPFERAAEFVGWLPHHGDRKCGAWRCSKCGRVTNVMPPTMDTTGPWRCPWCDEPGTYEKLPD